MNGVNKNEKGSSFQEIIKITVLQPYKKNANINFAYKTRMISLSLRSI
jgi:hypothetical protein